MDEYTENNLLADQLQAALIIELNRRNAPYISIETTNHNNVSLDIRIGYGESADESFIRYANIWFIRRKIEEASTETLARDFIEVYIRHLREIADWKFRITSEILKRKDVAEGFKKLQQEPNNRAIALLDRLKHLKD